MENSTDFCRIVIPDPVPLAPPSRETQRRYQILEDIRRNNPELLAKIKEKRSKRKSWKPVNMDAAELQKLREAGRLERLERLKKNGPVKLNLIPHTIRDTSEELTCYTEFEADWYNNAANADPREQVFKVLNPLTGKPDEAFTACVIKRFHKDKCDSSLTAMPTTSADDLQGTSVLKRHRDQTGIADELLAAAPVLKRHHEDFSESSETVVDAPGNS
ncbi:uncharacterized protein [Rutidosis leptorrhynchoides]|uniref:uncharacterized protein n=1 Tax=Rutidosis leptorrhynchoides TaxID=125765 RepID=UPI003A99A26B